MVQNLKIIYKKINFHLFLDKYVLTGGEHNNNEGDMNSFGLNCARMAGIDFHIVKRASKIRSSIMNGRQIESIELEKEEIYNMLLQKDDWNYASDTEVNDIVALIQNIL